MLDPEKPLYHRLGGYDVIAAFVDKLQFRLHHDPQIGAYWKGKSDDTLAKDRQLTVDFLCAAFGGPVFYLGRDMKTAHKGLEITESDWDVFMAHLDATLDALAVAEREKNDVLAAATGLKHDVVEVSPVAADR